MPTERANSAKSAVEPASLREVRRMGCSSPRLLQRIHPELGSASNPCSEPRCSFHPTTWARLWLWVAATNLRPSTTEILTTVVGRLAQVTTLRDYKKIAGVGQQQVRFAWANIGVFCICLWTFAMTES